MDQPFNGPESAAPPVDPGPIPSGRRGLVPAAGVEPDPGSRKAALIAWLVLLVVLPLVVALQQMQANAVPETDPAQINPPRGDQIEVSARMGARATYGLGTGGPSFQQQVDGSVQAAESPLQRFRGAISAGELIGPEEAADRLERVVAELESGANAYYPPDQDGAEQRRDQLLADARMLLPYYESLAADADDVALTEEAFQALEERHGFFADLARIAPLPADHPEREALLGGAVVPLVIMFALIAVVALALLASLGLGITALVFAGMGRIRFAMPRPRPGGSVYLESAVVFVVGFALLQVAGLLAAQLGQTAQVVVGLVTMPAQWLLLLTPLWPLLRGVPLRRIRDDLGLRAPKGVVIEVLMGTVGYLALLPLMLAGVAVMLVIMAVMELISPADPDALGPTNPILEMIKTLDPFTLVMLFALATVWAPLCEELVFRGALFRHLRGRMVLPLAAVVSAVVFGMMHGYSFIQLIPVTVLGFNFALLRAWRGSLIGPIVAHALNNAVVLSLMYALGFTLYG